MIFSHMVNPTHLFSLCAKIKIFALYFIQQKKQSKNSDIITLPTVLLVQSNKKQSDKQNLNATLSINKI